MPGGTFIMRRREKNQGKKRGKQRGGNKTQEVLNDLFRDSKYFQTNSPAVPGMCRRGIWGMGTRWHLQCGETGTDFLPKLFLDGKLDSWLNQIDFRKFLIPVGIRNHISNWNLEAEKKGELWWKVSSEKWASVCSDFPPDPILLQLLNISPVKPYFDGELNIFS